MPDIQLRFNNDMLVLSAPPDATLERQGVDLVRDRQYLNLIEPDSLVDALQLELMAGAQCLVTCTEDVTPARLAHVRMEDDLGRIAKAALDVAVELKPQHTIVEVGPCGLPLDPASRVSLNEHRAQYAEVARAFESADVAFDAFFLNGFEKLSSLKCALMGLRQVSDKPVFASVVVEGAVKAGGMLPDGKATLPEAVAVMADLGASVVGFETADPAENAVAYAEAAVAATDLPVLAQLRITDENSKYDPLAPLDQQQAYTPETLGSVAVRLYGAGVQFLRATGDATPACTGALAATVFGLTVHR